MPLKKEKIETWLKGHEYFMAENSGKELPMYCEVAKEIGFQSAKKVMHEIMF